MRSQSIFILCLFAFSCSDKKEAETDADDTDVTDDTVSPDTPDLDEDAQAEPDADVDMDVLTDDVIDLTGDFSVGGTLSGLAGTVVLQNNGGDDLVLTENGTFTFPTLLAAGSAYEVTVFIPPVGQNCTVANASGTVTADVSDVEVTCVLSPSANPNTYWVHPADNAATWDDSGCRSITDPGPGRYCSLALANSQLVPGDAVYLKAGTYNTHVFPDQSGTGMDERISYIAAPAEEPIISDTAAYATYQHGIALLGRSYIKVEGVTTRSPLDRPLMITHGASYNEVKNCRIVGRGTIQVWDGVSTPEGGTPCVHNWLHGNIIAETGYVSDDCNDIGGMQIGVPAYDKESNHNTIEDNVFYCGGHHNLETYTKYNVIRGNVFHDEGCMEPPAAACTYGPDTNGLYGNRNIQIYDGYDEDGKFNLIEGNRFGHAGPPPDDDGGDGFTLTAPKNIVRYNAIFNSHNNGLLMKLGASSRADNNRVYNNTIYNSGRYENEGPQWQGAALRWYGSYEFVGNVVKNNLIYLSGGGNDVIGNSANDSQLANNWLTADGDPGFVNTDMSDFFSLTLPDLNLGAGSGALDGGIALTQSAGAGTSATELSVDDALYFQDGTLGSVLAGHEADWIAVGTVDNAAQIQSVDYATNTITLASPLTWSDGDDLWLVRKSDGVQVLFGAAPDYGAFERP
jgi:hypothetical protein